MRRYAIKRSLLDIPNRRSSHSTPTPRGGGIAIVFAFVTSALLLVLFGGLNLDVFLASTIGGGGIAIIGLVDDWKPRSAGVRLLVQLAAAVSALLLLFGIHGVAPRFWEGLSPIFAGGLIALAMVWSTNLFNFMDGIDGLAASEAVFVSGASAFLNFRFGHDAPLSGAMLCLCAASLGFLIWNWPPARIFMGDVGSGFLGFVIAELGLSASRSGLPIQVLVILLGAFLCDATLTLMVRIMRRERFLEAHRTHAYQHLSRRWQAHRPVTLLYMSINVFWLLPLAVIAATNSRFATFATVVALAPLAMLFTVQKAGRGEA
jgi:Fuc2NAc and GlcNAc transferase